LYVGRVSYEKNIDAFLDMPWHGSKVVCGVGPLEADLKSRYPDVRWLGVLPRDVLAGVYAGADVFTFPSRHETFGLVMLEAMATGTPVAAYPVDGPLEVLPMGDQEPFKRRGGVLSEDLGAASLAALRIPRTEARLQALDFSWEESTRLFESHLVPITRSCVFHSNHLSDPTFEAFLRSTGRYAEYMTIRDTLLPSLSTTTKISLSNTFAEEVPRLRVTWGDGGCLYIGFTPALGQFTLGHEDKLEVFIGLDELLQKVAKVMQVTHEKVG
jgi:hypothetical protein